MGLGTGAVGWAPGMGCAANSTRGSAFGFTLGLGEAAWGQQGWEPWDVPYAMFCRHWGLAVSGLAVSIHGGSPCSMTWELCHSQEGFPEQLWSLQGMLLATGLGASQFSPHAVGAQS